MFDNLYNLNPAASGFNGSFISHISVSKKWLGINGSPSTQVFSNSIRLGEEEFYDPNMFLNRPLINIAKRVGLGLTIFNESNGPLYHTGLLFAYAYHLPVQRNRLSFGLSGIITHYRLNTKEFEPIDEADPDLYTNNSALIPDANLGMMYYNRQFFIGISAISLFNASKIMDHINTFPDIVVCGGYKFDVNNNFKLEPSLFIWRFGDGEFSADYNAKLFFRNEFWLLISYKGNKDISAGISLNLKTGLHLQYSYAVNTTGLADFYQGSHYISLQVNVAYFAQKINH
jgi:type IX secretion system PorP/SprF family membrane protein